MKHQFTLSSTGQLIHISQLTPDTRNDHGPYSCPSCGNETIPALGNTMIHHFRHKASQPRTCGPETYLHESAKKVIAQSLAEAIRERKPYPMRRWRNAVCTRWKDALGVTCARPQVHHEIDLARWVTSVDVEKHADGYVADVLVYGEEIGELLIEVAVTHPCDMAKIASGKKIIEVSVASERDVEALRHGIDCTRQGDATHNLKELPPVESRCAQDTQCDTFASCFMVYASGRSFLEEAKPVPAIARALQAPAIVYHRVAVMDYFDAYLFNNKLARSFHRILSRQQTRARYDHDVDVRSCLLCRRHAIGQDNRVWCCAKQSSARITDAVQCPKFSPFETKGDAVISQRMHRQRTRGRRWRGEPDVLE